VGIKTIVVATSRGFCLKKRVKLPCVYLLPPHRGKMLIGTLFCSQLHENTNHCYYCIIFCFFQMQETKVTTMKAILSQLRKLQRLLFLIYMPYFLKMFFICGHLKIYISYTQKKCIWTQIFNNSWIFAATLIFLYHLFQNKDGQFFVPFDSELECRQNVVVYDSNSTSTKEMSMY